MKDHEIGAKWSENVMVMMVKVWPICEEQTHQKNSQLELDRNLPQTKNARTTPVQQKNIKSETEGKGAERERERGDDGGDGSGGGGQRSWKMAGNGGKQLGWNSVVPAKISSKNRLKTFPPKPRNTNFFPKS